MQCHMLTVVQNDYPKLAVYAECHYAECHNIECNLAECHYANVILLSVIMLSVVAPGGGSMYNCDYS